MWNLCRRFVAAIAFAWQVFYRLTCLLAAVVLAALSFMFFSQHNPYVGGAFAACSLLLVFFAFRRRKSPLFEHGAGEDDAPELRCWRNSPTREIKSPRGAPLKLCMQNIGKPVAIVYRGRSCTITPLRAYYKPEYGKSYVDAMRGGEQRTFAVDEMELP